MPGGAFCSDECYQKMEAFQNRVEKLDEKKGRGGFQLGTWLTRLVIVGVVAAILYYVIVVQDVRSVSDLIKFFKGLVP